jgi:hypothetical protein
LGSHTTGLAAFQHQVRGGRVQRTENQVLPNARSNNMTAHIPEEFFLKLIDRSPFVIMGNTVPPKNSNDDEEDEEDEEEEDENRGDEPPVVREPDED